LISLYWLLRGFTREEAGKTIARSGSV